MNPPSLVLTVVMYVPGATSSVQEINPLLVTESPSVTGFISNDTFLFVAFSGVTIAFSCLVPAVPATAVEVLGDTVIPVAGIIPPPPCLKQKLLLFPLLLFQWHEGHVDFLFSLPL